MTKFRETGDGGEGMWVYGYPCGEPTLDRQTSACADHFYPRHSPFPAFTKPRTPKQ